MSEDPELAEVRTRTAGARSMFQEREARSSDDASPAKNPGKAGSVAARIAARKKAELEAQKREEEDARMER
eukprot:COSAG01_NODE_38906_length_483_cov_5.750000_1_plen_70_part_10